MDCKTVKNQTSLWLDGRLTFGEEAFLQHLGSCAACARETAELQSVLAALHKTAAAFPAPQGFALRVMGRIREEPVRRRDALPFKKLAMAASFLFLLGMNSLLVSRYLRGSGPAPSLPAPVPGQARDPGLSVPPPDIFTQPEPDRVEQPDTTAPDGQEAPTVQKQPVSPAKSTAVATVGPAPVAPVRRPILTQPVSSPEPAPPARQQEPELQTRVALLPPAVIPGPEVFVQQRRMTEGVLLKVAVTELQQASQRLAEAAEVQGLTPVMASEALAADGRLIKVYRYEVPYMQANRFVAEALTLGRVLDERHVAEDVSELYGQKLEQYRQLAARAQDASAAEAEELHSAMNGLVMELVGMHSTARELKAVTIWLES